MKKALIRPNRMPDSGPLDKLFERGGMSAC